MRAKWTKIAIGLSLAFVVWVFYKLSLSAYKYKHSASYVAAKLTIGSFHEKYKTKHTEHSLNLEQAIAKIKELEKKLALKEMEAVERDQLVAPIKKFTGHKLVHLDLKGAPPKMPYLIHLLPSFKKWGATGLLVEYEDTFPYHGDLDVLRSPLAYRKIDISQLVEACKEHGLFVVPLVQTFGHLEFVLKHKQFAALRETPEYTNSVCPNNNGSVPLVTMMIDQVLALHPGIEWFHVGGDEVWNLKTCTVCEADSRNKAQLFVHHMTPVLKHVKSKGVTPLMWDDMMREWDIEHLKALSGIVEPMVWAYADRIRGYFPPGMWNRYAQVFPKMWAASAFKGATRPDSNYVPVGFHVDNNLDWLRVITNLPKGTEMVGIALTGWSRYDHYATLCELLPAALPSLAFCLGALKEGSVTTDVRRPIEKELGLPEDFNFYQRGFNEKKYKPPTGAFPGHEVFTLVNQLQVALYRMEGMKHLEPGWMLKRELDDKFLSFYHMDKASQYLHTAIEVLGSMKTQIVGPLNEIYSEQIVKEWVNDKIDEKLAEATTKNKRVQDLRKTAAETTGAASHKKTKQNE